MKGLLLKDAYQIWHYAKGVIVATVVMMGAGVVTIMNGANFFIVYAGFLMGMMPMTLLAYDQASKFSEYSAALPVTKEQLVGSKYIIGLCGLVLAELFAAAALGVASLHWTAVDHALVVSTLVQVGMTTLLNSAVLLPLNYRFGYEKAKVGFYFIVGALSALMGFSVAANEDGIVRNLLPQSISSLGLLGIAAGGRGRCRRRRLWRCMRFRGGCPLHGTERQSSKMKKSQIAGILFGAAMGVLFSVSMGTVGFVLGASFAILGMVMFKGLDDPQDKK